MMLLTKTELDYTDLLSLLSNQILLWLNEKLVIALKFYTT